ncbi:MAG: M23 family metallopeptidase [Myxococcota bacterium]
MSWGGRCSGRGVSAVGLGLGLLLTLLAASACRTPEPPIAAKNALVHTVKRGETLWRISRQYDSSVTAIARANRLRDPTRIAVGQKLVIPAGTAKARVGSNGADRWLKRDRRGRSPGVHFQWPVRGQLASRYGLRGNAHHDGIDISGRSGIEIRAAEAGRVIHSDDSLAGYGNVVILKHAGVFSTVYAHNRRNLVKVGEFVERGQVIAELGQSGRASAPHLHFEIRRHGRPADPLDYLR